MIGKDVIYSQDLGYSILGLRILKPGNLVLGLRFKDPESYRFVGVHSKQQDIREFCIQLVHECKPIHVM